MKRLYLPILALFLLLTACSKDDNSEEPVPNYFFFYLMDASTGDPLVNDFNALYTFSQVKVLQVGNYYKGLGYINMGSQLG